MIKSLESPSPVDYVLLGHITQDITPKGMILGGTATYAGLTARALGLRVGVVTAISTSVDLSALHGLSISNLPTKVSTVFENVQTPSGRAQTLHSQAAIIHPQHVPPAWRTAPIIHFGPVAQEIDPQIFDLFPRSFIGLTPQGWLRAWQEDGAVFYQPHPQIQSIYRRSSCVIISIEDVQRDESAIEEIHGLTSVLVVTEANAGCRVYWNGDVRRFRAPVVNEVDATGAGDIFAAAFFFRMATTRDPWIAAEFATKIAARSVTRRLLNSPPTPQEVQESLIEIIGNA
ncbi:PfkB family carbohydrate kinase [Ornatilinea apprima]|uniref:PfkB family carbohydrate kinase n=1 Tax=Ornatilinea apprima TaxID=1134406 RepID=UPI0009EC53CE|nr:PfkB family carbohydrate kinase [Ornatilinea apprima]